MTGAAPRPAAIPLLATKLHPPRRRRALVARPRLDALASRSHHRALTLVSAPAGFGKTTLVADWFADDAGTAWLSLDPRDDDPVRFWTYVIAALSGVVADLSDEAASLLEAPGPSLEAVVATLVNELETVDADLALVLDDYHVIERVEIHESVAFLLEHLPPRVRLVIAARADPPLPLATLRARGDLLEVRAADLRFTPDEAASYLNGPMDLTLDDSDIELLEARTEGWIAALQLAALSMQGRADPGAFIAEFAGDDRFILDYLADEVLGSQTPEVRAFLLDTSILGRLTGPLCAAVTDRPDAAATLDELDRSNLFLIALDDRRTWYRYHHLFGDVLRARLLAEHPDRVALLHRRASDWFAANDEPQEAIVHALAADDPARAAELIERVAPAMHRVRQEALLRCWLEALPADTFTHRPVLTVLLVGARMSTGDPTGVEALLERAEASMEHDEAPIVVDHAEYARLPAMVAMYRSGLAVLAGDSDAAVAHATRVLDLAAEEDMLHRGAAAALIALARWREGDLEIAGARYAESVACFERGDYIPDLMGCSLALADIQITRGRLRDAQRTFEAALRHTAERPGLRGAADMHVGLAGLAIERNDLEAATDHLRSSAELGEHQGLPQHPYRWRVATARLHRARGELDAALALLVEAEARYATDFSPPVRPVAAVRVGVQLELGDVGAGLRWASERGLGADDELTYLREFEHLTLARVLVARGSAEDVARAVGLLRRLLAAADQGGRDGSAIEVLVALAAAHDAAGNRSDAAAALADALDRAEPEGYVRTFLDAGPVVGRLLRSLEGVAGQRAERLLASERSAAARPTARFAGPDELSDRELDVLRLLRSDLSGPEIARALHVSLNTLRTHTKHIYTKLGATNRREALTRAAELGL